MAANPKPAKKAKRLKLAFISDPAMPLKYRVLQQLLPSLLNLTDIVPDTKQVALRNRTHVGQVQLIHLPEVDPTAWTTHYEPALQPSWPSYTTRRLKASGPSRRIEPALATLLTLSKDADLRGAALPSPDPALGSTPERWYALCLTPAQQQEHDYHPGSALPWLGGHGKDDGEPAAKAVKREPADDANPDPAVRAFGLDCEMVETAAGSALARVTLVDEAGAVVYDSLAQPDMPVIDYKTAYSGITATMLQGVTTTLAEVGVYFATPPGRLAGLAGSATSLLCPIISLSRSVTP